MNKRTIPIGIPEVPLNNNDNSSWVDIYTKLYQERVIFLFQVLTDDFINQILASLLYFDFENNRKPIYFYINSNGGSLTSGLALYDMMNYIRSDIVTLCMGISSSISSLILSNGSDLKRLILPHSRVMLHQPEFRYYGQASDVLLESEEILRLRKLLGKLYSEKLNQTLNRIAKDIDYNCFLSSREAKSYGIIDQIVF